MIFHISLLLFYFIVIVYHARNCLYVANYFGHFSCIRKLHRIYNFYFPSESTPSKSTFSSIFTMGMFSEFCDNFCCLFFFRDKQLMEYSKLCLWSNAQSFGDSLMPSLGSGFLLFHNKIYDIVPRTQQKLILSEKKLKT